jgi:type IV pilus assembly protein PilV
MGWAAGTDVPATSQASKNCATSACNHAELAAYDIREWKRSVERTLPMGNANTFLSAADAATNQRQLGVLLRWRENERSDAGSDF